jgi:hypothetical protein
MHVQSFILESLDKKFCILEWPFGWLKLGDMETSSDEIGMHNTQARPALEVAPYFILVYFDSISYNGAFELGLANLSCKEI